MIKENGGTARWIERKPLEAFKKVVTNVHTPGKA
jgi:hypothetical protein